jgi:outer membrane scaffolding protein for murein synthesis (MipA/OmpV family)
MRTSVKVALKNGNRMRCSICLAFTLVFAAGTARAQHVPTGPPIPTADDIASRDSLTLALGVAVLPDYEGSDDYRLIPAVGIRGHYHRISFYSRGLYLYADLVPSSGGKVELNAGPIVGVRLNRTSKIKDDFVGLLFRRRVALEAGGFVGVTLKGLTNPYDRLALQLDAVHDAGKAHKSTVFTPNVSFSSPLSRQTYVSAGIGLDFVTKRYADYYFSVTPADALASGLARFNAGGGLKNWSTNILLNQSLTGDLLHGLGIFGLANYSQLLGDFKRSPIVSDRGSASQWQLAAGFSYTW